MIEKLQEITEWEEQVPNHIYYVKDKTKLVAYIQQGTTKKIILTKPLMFSKSRRKFKKL